MATAASAVFETAELLEHILSDLPTKQLAKARRVSSTWRDAVAQSTKLRKQLYQVPIKVISVLKYTSQGHNDLEPYISKDPNHIPEGIRIISLHPMLQEGTMELQERLTMIEGTITIPRMLSLIPGQWENMFVSQPPCQKVRFGFLGDSELMNVTERRQERVRNHDVLKIESIEDATGVRLRSIVANLRHKIHLFEWITRSHGRIQRAAVFLEIDRCVVDISDVAKRARGEEREVDSGI